MKDQKFECSNNFNGKQKYDDEETSYSSDEASVNTVDAERKDTPPGFYPAAWVLFMLYGPYSVMR